MTTLALLGFVLPLGFIGGAVLHTGPRAFRLGDDIAAVPIARLWS